MAKYKVQTLNNIADKGLQLLKSDQFDVASDLNEPDILLLRSFDLHKAGVPSSVKAVGRAGAGVNNIPVDDLTKLGVPVFNTPGANANAVKELVLSAMLLASRNICQSWQYVEGLQESGSALNKQVEQGKKQFVGFEIAGRTLGIIGLGAIGVKVANVAVQLGMNVVGFDPVISVKQAWQLDANVEQANTMDQLLAKSDFISLHVPLNDNTKGMIDSNRFTIMKEGAVLMNFARAGIVDHDALTEALASDKLHAYINDFPSEEFRGNNKVISLPHLGASTHQAEENCAVMVAKQIINYLDFGNITNSVNFPEIEMPWNEGYRIAIVNENIPNMVGQISTTIADQGLNMVDLINKSRSDIAYTLIDVDQPLSDDTVKSLQDIDGVISVRCIS